MSSPPRETYSSRLARVASAAGLSRGTKPPLDLATPSQADTTAAQIASSAARAPPACSARKPHARTKMSPFGRCSNRTTSPAGASPSTTTRQAGPVAARGGGPPSPVPRVKSAHSASSLSLSPPVSSGLGSGGAHRH
eukprot:scaffold12077_cov84-Isochrysis_galbana.AAC.1